MRLTGHPLHSSEVDRLASIIHHLHPPALKYFFQNLGPGQGSVWDAPSVRSTLVQWYVICNIIHGLMTNAGCSLCFDWLFVCATPTILEDRSNRAVLVESLFTPSALLTEIQRAICLITHFLTTTQNQHSVQRDLLLLSASIVQNGRMILSAADFVNLKNYIFMQSQGIKDLCFSQSLEHTTREG